MQASSELPLTAERVRPEMLFEKSTRDKSARPVPSYDVSGEEFPPELPGTCDWMLQPASHRPSRFIVSLLTITGVALLIAVTVFAVYWLPRAFPSLILPLSQ